MAISNQNFFALLGDNDETDASSISANIIAEEKEVKKPASAPAAKLPSKPLPPSEAVKEAQKAERGGERGRGRGRGRGGRSRGEFDETSENYRGYQGLRARNGLPPADGPENGPPAEGGGGGFRGRGTGRGRGRGRGRARESDNEDFSKGAFEEDPSETRANETRPRERFYAERGDRVDRGGDRGDRGGERVDRGGDRVDRGGDRVDRGGDRADRGDRVDRGGDRGDRIDRGGDDRVIERRDRDFPPRRQYDRRNTTGRSFDVKRSGAGRGNWGTSVDLAPEEGEAVPEEVVKPEGETEAPKVESEEVQEPQELTEEQKEKEREDKEMTLDEYEKMLSEKRKALAALRSEERKVEPDKTFEKMQLVDKKSDEDIFIKLRSEKSKKKEVDKDDKSKKASVSINEFLKNKGDNSYRARGRPGGRLGRGGGGNFSPRHSGSGSSLNSPNTEDHQQFPTLGGGK